MQHQLEGARVQLPPQRAPLLGEEQLDAVRRAGEVGEGRETQHTRALGGRGRAWPGFTRGPGLGLGLVLGLGLGLGLGSSANGSAVRVTAGEPSASAPDSSAPRAP